MRERVRGKKTETSCGNKGHENALSALTSWDDIEVPRGVRTYTYEYIHTLDSTERERANQSSTREPWSVYHASTPYFFFLLLPQPAAEGTHKTPAVFLWLLRGALPPFFPVILLSS